MPIQQGDRSRSWANEPGSMKPHQLATPKYEFSLATTVVLREVNPPFLQSIPCLVTSNKLK